jgi:hypothetical protein
MRPSLSAVPVAALLTVAGSAPLGAQRLSVGVSRWLTTPAVSEYRLSISRYDAGPLALTALGQLTAQGPRADGARLGGLGADLTLRFGARARPYMVVGVSAGVLDLRRGLGVGAWAGWSAGIGVELVRISLAALATEARYQELSRRRTRGLSLGARLGSLLGRREPTQAGGRREPTEVSDDPAGPLPPSALDARRRAVVDAAIDAIGAPYRWGGTTGNGFDCSGLISYAYAQIGVELPRQSRDQAGAGVAIDRELAALAAGDILTFAERPSGPVTLVGLYLGEGRFIHSTTEGVQQSRLASSDPLGSWWYRRWLGARRVLESR